MNFEMYANEFDYPQKPRRPILGHKCTAQEARQYADEMDAYEKALADWTVAVSIYRNRQAELTLQFKKDAFAVLGIADNPKAEKLYEHAYDDAHSEGYQAIFQWMEDMAELIR